MNSNLVNCFVCDASCVAKDQFLGSQLTRALTMPLSALLSKCLPCIKQLSIDVEKEYFCSECSRKIEEYDQFVQLCVQIETELYEQFQHKLAKEYHLSTTESVVERENVNEVPIHFDPKIEKDVIESHFVEFDSTSEVGNNQDNQELKRKVKTKTKIHQNINKKRKKKSTPKSHYKIEQVFCDICGRSYMSKGALSVHIIKHLKQSPHGNLIESEFDRKKLIKFEIIIFSYIECSICKKTFTQRIGLTRHMPIHTGEKKHQVNYVLF